MDASAGLLPALDQRDDVAALGCALDLWARHRDAGLAELIDVLDERVRAVTEGPRGRTREDFHARWCALADSDDAAVVTGWLCATLTSKLPIYTGDPRIPETYLAERFAALLQRVERLASRCPDPRIARAAIGLMEQGAWGGRDGEWLDPLYQPIVGLIERAGDPAGADALQDLLDAPRAKLTGVREWSAAHLPPVIAGCRCVPTTAPPPAVVEAVARVVVGSSAPRPPEEAAELFEHVLADASDLDARAVLADLWIEAGDPRGRFVARQLQGHGEDDPEVRRLLRAHRAEWLGPDLDATLQVTFANGFPLEGALRQNHKASEAVWVAAAADPRLATFEVIRQGKGNQRWYEQFVRSPQARNLRTVDLPSRALVEAAARRTVASLQRLEMHILPDRATADVLASGEGFVSVRELSLLRVARPTVWLDHLQRSGFSERIEVLEVDGRWIRWTTSPPKRRVMERWPGLVVALPRLRRFRLINPWALSVDLERADDGWVLRLYTLEGGGTVEPLVHDGPVWLAVSPRQAATRVVLPHFGREELPVEPMALPEGVVRVEAGLLDADRRALAERWGVPVSEIGASPS